MLFAACTSQTKQNEQSEQAAQTQQTEENDESKQATQAQQTEEYDEPEQASLFIEFQDAKAKEICLKNWDNNKDGELSFEEAAAVTKLGEVFKGSEISAFDELIFFTGLTSIEGWAFEECSSLTCVAIPESVTSIEKSAFNRCTSLASVIIPNSVISIGSWAFNKCTSLTSVTIPGSVTSIEGYAFYDCTSLTSICCMATTPPKGGDDMFGKGCAIYVPSYSVRAYKSAKNWSRYADYIDGYGY